VRAGGAGGGNAGNAANAASAAAEAPSCAALDCALGLDRILSSVHPRAAAEVRQLLRLFDNGMTGLLCTGHLGTFTAASAADKDRRLEAWRRGRLSVMRSGYQAMKRLAHATYYSSPETYALVGYAGPPSIAAPAVPPADGAPAPGAGMAP
jgi:hypothetical protein